MHAASILYSQLPCIPPPLSKIYPSFITCSLNYSIIMTSSKRKVSRREVPYLGTLLEKFPFTRLPTKLTVLRRLVFITETAEGNTISKAEATNKTSHCYGFRYDELQHWNKKGCLHHSSRGSPTTTPLDGLSTPCFGVSHWSSFW